MGDGHRRQIKKVVRESIIVEGEGPAFCPCRPASLHPKKSHGLGGSSFFVLISLVE